MKFLAAYSTKFDAGHRYTVRVEVEREASPNGDEDRWLNLQDEVERAKDELANRDLAKMLGPHHPSVWGIAAFFYERTQHKFPVTKVEVHESDGPTAIIESTDTF